MSLGIRKFDRGSIHLDHRTDSAGTKISSTAFAKAVVAAQDKSKRPVQGRDGLTLGRIELEKGQVDEGAWDDYDIRSAKIAGHDGQLLYRVEVRTWEETATVYDKNNKVIVQFDEDGKPTKGEAWNDEFKLKALKTYEEGGPDGVDSPNSLLTLEDGVQVEIFTGKSSKEMNRVLVYAATPVNDIWLKTDILDLFAAPDSMIDSEKTRDFGEGWVEEPFDYPNGWPVPFMTLNDDFSDEGSIAFTMRQDLTMRQPEVEEKGEGQKPERGSEKA